MDLATYVLGPLHPQRPSAEEPSLTALFTDVSTTPPRTLTLNEFRDKVFRIAAGLQKRGIGKGAQVMVMSENNLFFTAFLVGCIATGAAFIGIPMKHTSDDLAHQLSIVEPSMLLVAPQVRDTALEAQKKAGSAVDVIIYDGQLSGYTQDEKLSHWSELLEDGEAFSPPTYTAEELETNPAVLCFTSG